jgi:hypothetical protein
MNGEQMLNEFNALPPVAQKEVLDFIAFLRQRYAVAPAPTLPPLKEEPFVGMWQNRSEMVDSRQWVKKLREQEWG